MPSPLTRSERETLALELLQEVVYASRATGSLGPGAAACGLGDGPALGFELTARVRELLAALWPAGLEGPHAARLRAETQAWVERQDTLDRKRNHFMKAFRGEHGLDRTRYTAEQRAAWEEGLAEIYGEMDERRQAAAQSLLGALDGTST